MARGYLSFGSNLGDRLENCRRALVKLDAEPDVQVTVISDAYETDPVGRTDQPAFINLVVEIETGLEPRQVFGLCKRIEADLGRTRGERWGPRVIDLDLLLLGDRIIEEGDLTVPHPRMHQRRFVLQPLADIAPGLLHPRLGQTTEELLHGLGGDHEGVRRLGKI